MITTVACLGEPDDHRIDQHERTLRGMGLHIIRSAECRQAPDGSLVAKVGTTPDGREALVGADALVMSGPVRDAMNVDDIEASKAAGQLVVFDYDTRQSQTPDWPVYRRVTMVTCAGPVGLRHVRAHKVKRSLLLVTHIDPHAPGLEVAWRLAFGGQVPSSEVS